MPETSGLVGFEMPKILGTFTLHYTCQLPEEVRHSKQHFFSPGGVQLEAKNRLSNYGSNFSSVRKGLPAQTPPLLPLLIGSDKHTPTPTKKKGFLKNRAVSGTINIPALSAQANFLTTEIGSTELE